MVTIWETLNRSRSAQFAGWRASSDPLLGQKAFRKSPATRTWQNVYVQVEGGEHSATVYLWIRGSRFGSKPPITGTQVTRTWEYEPVFLWATDFEPPANATASGTPIENWVIRPKMKTVEKDGHLIDTHYTYGFSHRVEGNMEGNPGKAILAPTVIEQHLRGTEFKLRRDTNYENRVAIEGECHDYHGDDPYALALPISELATYVKAPGVEEVLGKTTTQYELAAFPFPTKIQQWATLNKAVETTFEYFTSGPNRGKLKKQTIGSNPDVGIENIEFTFGAPTKVQHPGLPASEMVIDFRGNVGSVTEAGVTKETIYDLIDRPKRTSQPTMFDAVTDYSGPTAPGMTAISYYENGGTQRHRTETTADEWHRPMATEMDVSATQSGVEEVFYNSIGLAETVVSATGSQQTTTYDVHGRPKTLETRDAGDALISTASFNYQGLSDGTTKVTETVTRDGVQTEKVTLSNFAGRILETSFNKGEPGAGGSVFSEDYAGGGHTRFVTTYDQASGLTTTEIRPYGAINGSIRYEVHDLLGRTKSVRDAEFDSGRSLDYEYDDRGLVCESIHPDGRKYQYHYDNAGRLVEQRLRTNLDPEAFDLVVLRNSYHPVHGYLETQVKKLAAQNTRVVTSVQNPDALGRPLKADNHIAAPLFWQPELERNMANHTTGEEYWVHQWRPLPDGSGLASEYILELKPRDGNRTSLYFPQIQQTGELEPWVAFSLHNEEVLTVIETQLADHPDRHLWLAEADLGSQMNTVLDPEQHYLFRVTGIDANYQASLPSYWWGDLPDLVVDSIDVQMNGTTMALDFRIFNGGTRRAEPSSTSVYVSPTPDLPADAQPAVPPITTPAIEPGFAAFHSNPNIQVNGSAYVIIVIDSGHGVTELNENNNLGREFLGHVGQHDPEKPDVLVEEMNVAYVDVGEEIQTYATYAIQNVNTTLATHQDGTASPGNSLTKLYLSSDNIISNDDLFLAAPECAPLGPLEREIQTTNLGAVGTAVPLHSTHMVAAANAGIDQEPQFHEGTNRFNNVATIELPQLEELGPDLVIPSFVHEGVSGGPGNLTMAVSFTLHNKGVWQAGASKVGFFYSTTPHVVESHQPLTLTNGDDGVAMDAIQPGWDERLTGSATLSIPSALGYLIVRSDMEDAVVERDEDNNWKAHTFAGYADLIVDGFSKDSASGSYTFRIKNIDSLPSEPTNVALYLDFEDQFHPFRSVSVWEAPLPELAPGDTSADLVTPPGWQPPVSNRDQYLFAVADSDQLVHERDETNNHSQSLLVEATGAAGDKPDLKAEGWGFTRDIWPDPPTLTAPDVQIGEFSSWLDPPWSAKPLQGNYRVRVAVDGQPIEAHFQVIKSTDATFGNEDDWIVKDFDRVFEEDTDEVFLIAGPGGAPTDFIRVVATTPNVEETRSTNNTATTRLSLPRVNAVHSLTNSSHVGSGPFTVEIYMSGDNEPEVSPGDDLIGLYIHPGFTHADTHPAPMIAYDGVFMDSFAPLQGWTMKFVVDALDAIEESDETNNVLVVDADPTNYHGPWLPRGLDPLQDPNEGTLAEGGPQIDRTTAVTQVQANGFQALDGTGLMELRFKMINHGKDDIELDNINIFASYDFGIKGAATLVFSSALAGDAQGIKAIPATIPNRGETGEISYRIRVPKHFVGSQYKLVFVANAHIKGTAEGATLLSFSELETRVLGFLEPARLGAL